MQTMKLAAVKISLFFSLCLPALLLFLPLGAHSVRSFRSSDSCDPANQRDPRTLRSDQITVLINGYSESRAPLLQSIAATYSASPLVSSVLVLWGNPATPAQTLARLAQNLSLSSFGPASISVVRQPSSSLNARFLPRSSIATQAVLICDDDVEVDSKSFAFAFRVWSSNPDRLVGFFSRSHDIDLSARKWIYTVHPDRYSIVLTKFMILKTQYLFQYSCQGGPQMSEMRTIVDRMQNCEDILMNFVVADEVNVGPILVGAERVRDWGDPRNDDDDDDDDNINNSNENDGGGHGQLQLKDGGEGKRLREVGLSSRRAEHRKRRGDCITQFHKVLGRMPLRYSYGKVVNSVGEQGLCMKGGCAEIYELILQYESLQQTVNNNNNNIKALIPNMMDIENYAITVSGCRSLVGIIMLGKGDSDLRPIVEKLDYQMSKETIIVGDEKAQFLYRMGRDLSNPCKNKKDFSDAVALVFARDREKAHGIGEIRFYATI